MGATNITCLQTERLLLQMLTPEVYKLVFTTYSDAEIKSFFGMRSDEAVLLEKEKYNGGMSTWNKSFLYFQLIDRNSSKIIGWCGFHTWYLQHFRAELGYGLYDDADKRQGLMKEALRTVIEYGFAQMNLNRIEAFVGAENIPSLKLMERFGFREEGILREHYCKNGRTEDSIVFSLLKKEFHPPAANIHT